MTSTTARRPHHERGVANRWHSHLYLIALLAIMLYPVAWLVMTSLKPTEEILESSLLLPRDPTLDNYVRGWDGAGIESFGAFLRNSAVIATLAVVGNLFSCALAGYALARLNFRGRAFCFAVSICMLLLPKDVLLIPQYSIFHALGWVNSPLPLLTPHFLAMDAFFVFLNVQFLRSLPRELDEAAAVDGCGPFRTFWHITLPLIQPALITTAIFTFIWTWNDYMPQLIYLNSADKFTLPVGLRMFLDATSGSDLGPMTAMSLVTLLPLFFLFMFFQRRLVQGIATSGLK